LLSAFEITIVGFMRLFWDISESKISI
jgi:hypothetical protein